MSDKNNKQSEFSKSNNISMSQEQIKKIIESEKTFRTLFENNPLATWISDAEGTIIRTNSSLRKKLNLTDEQIIGKYNVLKDENLINQNLMHFVEDVYKKHKPTKFSMPWKASEVRTIDFKSGLDRYVDLSFFPILNTQNQLSHVVCQWADITEQKQIEETLLRSEIRFREIMNQAADAIFIHNMQGEFLDVNKQACESLGYSRKELLQMSVMDTEVNYPDLQTLQSVWNKLEQEQFISVEGNQIKKDKTIFPVDIRLGSLSTNGEKQIIVISRDITERKRVENKLKDSEKRIRALIGNIPGVSYYCKPDENWTMEFISDEIEILSGYSAKDFIHNNIRSYASIIHPDDAKMAGELALKAIDKKKIYTLEYRIIASDGTIRWVYEKGQGIFDEKGKVDLLAGVILNITSRKIADNKIVAERDNTNNILEGTNAGTWDWNIQTGEVTINERWAAIMGYTIEELEPIDINTWIKSVCPDDLPYANDLLQKHFNGENKYYDVEFRQPHKDGRWIWVNARGKVVEWTADGKPLRMSGTHLDITERKTINEELKKYKEQLEDLVNERTKELEKTQQKLLQKERLATLGRLSATVAHEIRNPLGTIRTSAFSIGDAIERNEMNRIDRARKLIERNVIRCDKIITELLDYTRERILELKSVNIDNWIDKVISDIPVPDQIILKKDFKANCEIQIDKEYFRRALINVINNGCDAILDSESTGNQMKISTTIQNNKLKILISDQGCGMSENHMKKIFEPLFSTKNFGVGLGMPIVKNILEKHRGGIKIRSTKGQGTDVVLWLPISQIEEEL